MIIFILYLALKNGLYTFVTKIFKTELIINANTKNMKKLQVVIILAFAIFVNTFELKAQSTGGYDVLGVWAYVTLNESTPVVDGYYEFVFPTPPEGIISVDGPGMPALHYSVIDEYTYVYMRKCLLDTTIAEANRDQIEFEVYVHRKTNVPSISEGAQCYYYVIICLPSH